MFRKKRQNFYINAYEQIYVSNVVTCDSNMITILTVPKSSNYYPPYINRFLNTKYVPDVRLVCKESKVNFDYYIYEINFTLPNKNDSVDDEVIKYLNSVIFDLNIDYGD